MPVASSPLVVAHRGSSYALAEHTLAAYIRAIDEGADALECDVRLTRDGHLICMHDRRIDRTSNGRGPVSDLELSHLESLDFASWHPTAQHLGEPASAARYAHVEDAQDAAADSDGDGDELDTLSLTPSVLTLEQLLSVVVDAPRPVRLAIETKHPTRYAGLVEQELVRTLRHFGLADPPDRRHAPATVMSFAPMGLRRIRLLAPRLPTVLLMERVPPIRRDGSLPTGVGIAGPGIDVVRAHPEYVAKARGKGNQVYVWTVDDPGDIELVLGLGVDGVITNRPSDVLRRLDRVPAG